MIAWPGNYEMVIMKQVNNRLSRCLGVSLLYLQVENPLPVTSGLVVEVAWLLVRLVFWFFFNGFLLHFLYFASLKSADADVLHRLDKWTLAGVLYLLGQFMTCKYAVIYGLPYLQARLDGMWAPTPPACIAYVYHYSDMWRSVTFHPSCLH